MSCIRGLDRRASTESKGCQTLKKLGGNISQGHLDENRLTKHFPNHWICTLHLRTKIHQIGAKNLHVYDAKAHIERSRKGEQRRRNVPIAGEAASSKRRALTGSFGMEEPSSANPSFSHPGSNKNNGDEKNEQAPPKSQLLARWPIQHRRASATSTPSPRLPPRLQLSPST
jgi:hypothetical protein